MSTLATTNQKIAALRAAAKAAGADGVLLATSDPHCSEYLPAHYTSLNWFSGFTGENSTLVVTAAGSALWSDGRFYIQADRQLAGSEIESLHAGAAGVPTVEDYLKAHFSAGQTLLTDGSCLPAALFDRYAAALAEVGARLVGRDVVSPLWADVRPALPDTPCFLLRREQSGSSPAEKLTAVRAALRQAGATALAVTGLDCVAWLLDLRAHDLPCTPLAIAYAFVTQGRCVLFLADGRLGAADAAALAECGVERMDYAALLPFVAALDSAETVLVEKASTNQALYAALQANPRLTVKEGADPITALKGVKNATELANLKECHIRDGVAMVRFQMDLEQALAAGKPLRESDIDAMLRRRRAEQPGFDEESFTTIAAYGPNAAMMHYTARPGADSAIEPHGFLLVDCGGQYDCGTTDITRTYPVGPLTDNERKYYTWTLQSHIGVARARWLDYCTGFALDSFARGPLWQHGINYRCGTGHGVGFMGNVHEGPQSLRPNNNVVFRPGMTVTDEPGVYETDEGGIRIENELVCVDRGENQYGHWLGFEPLTFVPIDLSPVLPDELTRAELDWLNAYHKLVYDTLAPRLTPDERAWLAAKTAPLAR